MKYLPAAVLAVALAATGCAASGSPAPVPASSAGRPSAAPVPLRAAAAPAPASLGHAVTVPNSVRIEAKARLAEAGEYADGEVDGKIVVVTTTITNQGTKALSVGLMGYPKVSFGAGRQPAGAATDTDLLGSGENMPGLLAPGQSEVVKTGWGIPPEGYSDLRLEYSLPEYTTPLIFTGSVK